MKDINVFSSCPPFSLPSRLEEYEAQHSVKFGQVIIDAGAFDGLQSAYWCQSVGSTGKVISIEPDPLNAEVVRSTLALNRIDNQVILVTKGLWNKEDTIKFFEGGGVASSSLYQPFGATLTEIKTTTIDLLVEELNLKRVDFIKMDIEGAEIKALEGARKTLMRFSPHLAIAAYHVIEGNLTRPTVELFLAKLGYSIKNGEGKEAITYAIPYKQSN